MKRLVLLAVVLALTFCGTARARVLPTAEVRAIAHRALHSDAIAARATSSELGACFAGRSRVHCAATVWVLADDGGEWQADYWIYVLRRHDGRLVARSNLVF